MTGPGISGFRAHPDRDQFRDYVIEAPAGPWIGRLDYVAWGKSHNLLCYFTDVAGGGRYRLSTFWNRQFRPHGDGPAFDQAEIGTRYEITTELSKTGLPKFATAKAV
jgi:hypothetical protein